MVRAQVEFSNEVFGLSWHDKRWRVLQEGGPDDEDGGAARAAQAQTQLGMPIKRHFHTAVVWPDPASSALSSSDDEDNNKNKSKSKKEKGKSKADEDEAQEDGSDGKASPAQKMYVFGGKSNGYLNDLWAYDLGSLPRTASAATAARERALLLVARQLIKQCLHQRPTRGRRLSRPLMPAAPARRPSGTGTLRWCAAIKCGSMAGSTRIRGSATTCGRSTLVRCLSPFRVIQPPAADTDAGGPMHSDPVMEAHRVQEQERGQAARSVPALGGVQ
jgi:hypothetical protein